MALFLKPGIGLDISDHSIEAVFIVRRGDSLTVASYGRTTLPPGAIVGGYVERPDVVRLAIRKLLADQMTPPLPNGVNRVVFALPESQVYSHIFEVPRVADDAQLGRSLAIEADGYFPYPHDEMASGYAVIAQRPDRKDIFYAAVHKDTLKRYLALFASAGLALDAIENESSSIARAVIPRDETGPVLLADIGARVANVAVFDRDGIQFSETLETAGDAFTSALSRSLGISEEDADALKRARGLSRDLDQVAQKALRAQVERLAKDVAAAREYYETKAKRLVSRVVLCGGSTLMPGLTDALARLLSVPGRSLRVELADPWAGLDIDPALESLGIRDRGVLATTAVGLALRGVGVRKFSDIDFLPSLGARRPVAASEHARGPAIRPPGGLRALPRWVTLAAAVSLTLALAVGAWYAAFRLRAPAPSPVDATASTGTIAVSDSPEFTVEAAVGSIAMPSPPTLPIAVMSASVEAQAAIERTGGEEVIGRASGPIEIVNESPVSQTLIATTRFLSENGTLFRLDARVVVPAGGRVTASVTADQPGAHGDVPAGRFTIPGLPAATQRVVYGVTNAPMRGGLTIIGPAFTQEDMESLRARLETEAADALRTAFAGQVGEGRIFVEGSLRIVAIDIADPPAIGTPTGSFVAKAVVRAEAWTVSSSDAEMLMSASVPGALPPETLENLEAEARLGSEGAPIGILLRIRKAVPE